MRAVCAAGIAVLVFGLPAAAQQTRTRTTRIPGGVVTDTYGGGKESMTEEQILNVNGHVLRGFNKTLFGSHPEVESQPWTIYADGTVLFTFDLTMPRFSTVASGGGRTYVLVKGSQGPDEIDLIWIVDASAAKVVVSPQVEGCASPKGAVVDGGFRLTCAGRTPARTFKDGTLR